MARFRRPVGVAHPLTLISWGRLKMELIPDAWIRRALAAVLGFSFGGMYAYYVKIVGEPIFSFWPWMQTPLW